MYQAITTKYIGPTSVRGSRVKASCDAGSITLHWDSALNGEDNHIAAAKALAIKLDWGGYYVGGSIHGNQYAFVNVVRTDEYSETDEVEFDYDFYAPPPAELIAGVASSYAPST